MKFRRRLFNIPLFRRHKDTPPQLPIPQVKISRKHQTRTEGLYPDTALRNRANRLKLRARRRKANKSARKARRHNRVP